MMEAFFRTHAYLVEHVNAPVRRLLMDEINWNDRLIGIKGTRGVGKTTFLLQYAKEYYDTHDRKCLYVNMNNFYFQGRGIADFAGEFYRRGGKVLLVDQIFKETDWSAQLRQCYDLYPDLKIVQPQRFLVPRIHQPSDRKLVQALHARRHPAQSRTHHPANPALCFTHEAFPELSAPRFLSFLP